MSLQLKKYDNGWENRRMRDATPINLKRILKDSGIPQVRMCEAITLDRGNHPSQSTVTQITTRNIWPHQTPRRKLQHQITLFLRAQGVSEQEIATAFEIDESPNPLRGATPITSRRKTEANESTLEYQPCDGNQLPETEMLSQAAKKHFQLFVDPFQDDVQGPDDVFLSADQRYIREAMYQAAKHGGFLAVIGESGAGKTVLRKDLIDRIQRDGQPITVIQPRIIDKGRLTAGAICDAIICDISSARPLRSLEAKARQIEKLLIGSSRAGNSHVLLIEEAHDLTIQTLKYLKRFWELEDGFKRLLAIILVGQPELKGKLDERQNWEAREVIRRCEIAELQPMNGNLEQYLGLKFKRVGKELDSVFAADAFDALRDRLTLRQRGRTDTVSMLYPLVVNNAIKKAMNLAAECGEPRINADVIRGV